MILGGLVIHGIVEGVVIALVIIPVMFV